jgi:hypothetical protein
MDTCQDFRGADVDFRQFLDSSLTEVPTPSLCKLEVPPVIKTKPWGQKINLLNHRGKKLSNPIY